MNSLLTGYKILVPYDKISMSCDRKVNLLNDVTCRDMIRVTETS